MALNLFWINVDISLSKMKCLGQIIDDNGRKSDLLRLSAKMNMPAPTTVSTLQAFLVLVNYLIPNMHILISPLKKLLKKRFEIELEDQMSEFFWGN